MKKKAIALLIVLLGMFLFVPLAGDAHAAYSDNFSNNGYPVTIPAPTNFGPWTYFSTDNSCLEGYVQQFDYNQSSLTPPGGVNVFKVDSESSCNLSSYTSYIQMTVNSTSSTITINWAQKILDISHALPSNAANFTVSLSGTNSTCAVFGNDLAYAASIVGIASLYNDTWSQQSTSCSVLPATEYTLTLEWNSYTEADSFFYSYLLDNVAIQGAVTVFSPYNFIGYNANTHLPFDFFSYAGSFAKTLSTTTSTPQSNLTTPYLCLTVSSSCPGGEAIANAYLINIGVGSITLNSTYYPGYITQLIPAPSNSSSCPYCTFMSLFPPNEVTPYDIQLIDQTGQFPAATSDSSCTPTTCSTYLITQGSYNLTSGYIDATHGIVAYLEAGQQYTFTLTNVPKGAYYETTFNAGSSSSVSIVVLTAITSANNNYFSNGISFGATWTPATQLIVSYSDAAKSTVSLSFSIILTNNNGTMTVFSEAPSCSGSETCSYGTYTYTVPYQYDFFNYIVTSIASGSQTSTTLQDTSQTWVNNQWAGDIVTITNGTGAGQFAVIGSNTATTLTTRTSWSITPDSTSHYQIGVPIASQLSILFNIISSTVGAKTQSIQVGGGTYFNQPANNGPSLGSLGGLSFVAAGLNPISLAGWLIVIIIAGVFTVESAPIGAPVATGVMTIFGFAGILPTADNNIPYITMFVLSFIGFLLYNEQRSKNIYTTT